MKDTKWKIPKTWYDRLADWMGVGFLAASGFYLWANWQAIPREIPTPYGFSGQPDAWGDKSSCVVLLVIGVVMCLMMWGIEQFPIIWNTGVTVTEENRVRVYRILKNLLVTIRLVIAAIFAWMPVCSAHSQPLGGLVHAAGHAAGVWAHRGLPGPALPKEMTGQKSLAPSAAP